MVTRSVGFVCPTRMYWENSNETAIQIGHRAMDSLRDETRG